MEDFILNSLTHPHLYEENLVLFIDKSKYPQPIKDFKEVLDRMVDSTIKIEAVEVISRKIYNELLDIKERYNHFGPTNAHLFWAKKDSHSFETHVDPYDVVIKLYSGVKCFEVDGKIIELKTPGEELLIKANVPHRAVNSNESIIISYGLMTFIEERER